MGQDDGFRARVRGRAKAWVDDADAVRRRAGLAFPGIAAAGDRLIEKLAGYVAAEVAPGRLMPWLPVAFGFGIVLYFTADREPAIWAAFAAAAAGLAAVVLARRRVLGFPVTLALAATAAGFAVAVLNTWTIDHPILHFPGIATISGHVEIREERAKSDRIVIHVTKLEGQGFNSPPDRVRISVRKGTAPAVGDFITVKARLSPPLEPLRPGGYDFARDMFFQRIGASGFALGRIKIDDEGAQRSLWLRYAAALDGLREKMDDRIREILPGDRGSNDAMFISSLGHVLSISGYHMAVVAGIVFFVFRASLALVPSIASRYPIKKWAAAAAFAAATFYLLLSGSEVATQRSFIMIAIVLVGVMFNRPALTFRTLTIAALAVLLLAPQAVVHPSFQMSFAATLALIAGYQHGLPWRAGADSSLGTRAALWGAREIAGLVLASLVAGLATTPYVAFHFHRLAPYGVLANLLAMPVVSAWVMPMGILGVLLMPFGFDGSFWSMMGWGIDWMIAVSVWVTALPGAVGQTAAFGTGPMLLATAAMLLLCLLRTPLRWSGAILAVAAGLWAMSSPRPDVWVAADGQSAAVRGENGKLSVLHSGRDSFAVREWLAADADSRLPANQTINDGVRCDKIGCVGRLRDGRLVAMALAPDAIAEDCVRAAVVISIRRAPDNCQALVIDRDRLNMLGAIALRTDGDRFVLDAARPLGSARPWQPPRREEARDRNVVPDATPRASDLEPEDQ